MKKTNKSKKSLTILAFAIITLAFFAACTNPLLPGPKKKNPIPEREADEILTVNIAAAFDADGSRVTLTAEVSGSGGGTLSYQWYSNAVDSNEDGSELYGETDEDYRPPVTPNTTTFYYVAVTNVLNGKTDSAISNTVKISIDVDGNVEVLISEVEIPAVTIAAASDGAKVTLTAAASVSDGGELSYQWYRNTADRSEGGTPVAGETGTIYTPPVTPDGTSYYYVKATNTLNGRTASASSHTVKIVIQGGKITEILVSDTVETPVVSVTAASLNGSVTLTAIASVNEGALSYRWYKNTIDSSRGGIFIAGATGTTFTPPMTSDGEAYYYVKVTNTLKGQTAEASSNTVRIVVQGGGITEFIVSETVETPVVSITAENDGANVMLSADVSVSDGGALTYQWYRNTVDNSKNGSLIAGATRADYTPTTASAGTAYYYVKVTNTLKEQSASAVSNTVRIVVSVRNGEIVIERVDVSDPVKIPVVNIAATIVGRNVTITATASVNDGGTLTYQWFRNMEDNSKNGTPITGATRTTYAPLTASPGTTYYYVKVTNTLKGQTASAVSNIVGVVIPPEGGSIEIIEVETVETPTVTIAADVDGRNVTLTATAYVGDGGVLTYQWFRNNQNNKNGTEVEGATAEVYTPPTEIPGTAYYYVRATNTLNERTASATSNIMGVVVPDSGLVEIVEAEIPSVSVIASPAPGPYNMQAIVVITAAAAPVSDGGTVSYQWFKNTEDSNKTGTLIADAVGILYTAPTDALGTTYYYAIATNTLRGKSASSVSNVVEITVAVTEINGVAVSITPPIKAAQPDLLARTDEFTRYTAGTVQWSDANGPMTAEYFLGNAVYTAKVTLTASAGYTFAGNFTGTINGQTATITDKSDESVTLSHTFSKTLDRGVTAVAVLADPDKMEYIHGDALELDGLKIKVTYDDGDPDEGFFLDLVESLGSDNVSATPAHGARLRTANSGSAVRVTVGVAGGNTEDTLTVERKGLTITAVSHTKVYDSTTAVNQNALSVSTWTGVQFNNEVVTGINGIQAVYTSADAGTDTVDITDGVGTIVGQAANNYYVAGANNVEVTSGTGGAAAGIIKANPVVTWPTGLTASYGTGANTLASVSLTSTNGSATGINNTSITGTFSWTTSTRSVGDAGPRSHNMTFTPPDTTNYNTMNNNVSITVTGKPVTLTVGAVSRTLSAIDDNATFSVTVNGLVSGHTVTVNASDASTYGLTLSSNTGIGSTERTVTMTYDGTTTVTQATALSIGLTIDQSNNNYYTLSGSPTAAPTVADGSDYQHVIPVTQENITRFNEYANTAAGLTRYYSLSQNVTLTEPAAGQSNWTPIGTNTAPFTGSFEGNSRTIDNITIRGGQYTGMFSYVSGRIQQVGLRNVSIGGTYAGGVAATLINGTVQQCFVRGSVGGGTNAGGVVGSVEGTSTLQNCYSTANVTGSDMVGGVSYRLTGGTIQYCYSTGAVSVTSGTMRFAGGVVGSIGANTTVKCLVALNSSITTINSATTSIGRVYVNATASTSHTYLYGKNTTGNPTPVMTMRYNTNTTYSPTSDASDKDGATTTNYNTVAFWTTASNWGGTAWGGTGVGGSPGIGWSTSNVTTLGRPILSGFASGTQN